MKCKNCGAELLYSDGVFRCKFCGATYLREEFLPTPTENAACKIAGGVLSGYYGNADEIIIPAGVTVIGKGAFKDNLSVKKVVFSSTVTRIENEAFFGCANLSEITGYEKVADFGEDCFWGAGLKSISIGSGVMRLGKCCFSRMPELTTVIYAPHKILKHNRTFAYCLKLCEVKADGKYFFPSFKFSLEVRNNPNNKRPTFSDAFVGTPYLENTKKEYLALYKKGICPDCGGEIKKGLFHAKCQNCGIDLKNNC